ncbi:MAG: hypothetical protein ACP5IV_07990, partial [Caldisericia bacterium]
FKNKSAEEIAENILKLGKKLPDGKGFGNPSTHYISIDISEFDDFVRDIIGKGNITEEDIDKFIQNTTIQGILNYGSGNIPILEKIEKAFRNKLVDWRNLLINELRLAKENTPDDYGSKYVNRRYYQLDYPYIPMNYKKQVLSNVFIAIDTSGSINNETYAKEIGQVLNLVETEIKDYKIILFDDGIAKDKNGNKIIYDSSIDKETLKNKLLYRSYGGTDIKEVLDYCLENNARILILISDMDFDFEDIMKNKKKYDKFEKIFISTNKNNTEFNDLAKKFADKFSVMLDD